MSDTSRVYAPGCWDLLHVGHVRFLKSAAQHGELIVGVASDRVILADKGMLPAIPESQRVEMLSALSVVSHVALYDELDFVAALEQWQPGALAVGETWGEEKRHKRAEAWCKSAGAKVVKIPYSYFVSSSGIRAKCYGQQRSM